MPTVEIEERIADLGVCSDGEVYLLGYDEDEGWYPMVTVDWAYLSNQRRKIYDRLLDNYRDTHRPSYEPTLSASARN